MIGFDTTHPNFDILRYRRQLRAVVRWVKTRGRGTLQMATGFGKSACALLVLAKFFKKDLTKMNFKGTVLIVVPTTSLKEQWENNIKKGGFKNVSVLVINTVALKSKLYQVDLLILDR
jgi:superfamily II DNA or RNA helicase